MKSARFVVALVLGLLVFLGAQFAFGCSPTQAFAATSATAYTEKSLTLGQNQTEFVIPVTIEHPDAFAGVELALQTAEGIEVTSVTYSAAQSKAGPTSARGLVWFSTFSGANDFSGPLIASVHARYEGDENTQVVLDHAAFYTKEGSAFDTQNVPLRTVVTISREGATNTPTPLEPPDTGPDTDTAPGPDTDTAPGPDTDTAPGSGTDTAPGSGNPGSGALVGGTGSAGTTGTGTTGTVSTDTPGTGLPGTPTVEGSPTDSPATLLSAATPLAANSIPGDGAISVNTLILGFAIACLLAAIILGCLLIKKRSTKSTEETTREVL